MNKFKKGDKVIVSANKNKLNDFYSDLCDTCNSGDITRETFYKLVDALNYKKTLIIKKVEKDGYECRNGKIAYPFLFEEKDLRLAL